MIMLTSRLHKAIKSRLTQLKFTYNKSINSLLINFSNLTNTPSSTFIPMIASSVSNSIKPSIKWKKLTFNQKWEKQPKSVLERSNWQKNPNKSSKTSMSRQFQTLSTSGKQNHQVTFMSSMSTTKDRWASI